MYTILLLAHHNGAVNISGYPDLTQTQEAEQLSLSSANPAPSRPTHQQGMIKGDEIYDRFSIPIQRSPVKLVSPVECVLGRGFIGL